MVQGDPGALEGYPAPPLWWAKSQQELLCVACLGHPHAGPQEHPPRDLSSGTRLLGRTPKGVPRPRPACASAAHPPLRVAPSVCLSSELDCWTPMPLPARADRLVRLGRWECFQLVPCSSRPAHRARDTPPALLNKHICGSHSPSTSLLAASLAPTPSLPPAGCRTCTPAWSPPWAPASASWLLLI